MERGEAFAFVRAPSTLMVFLHFARDDLEKDLDFFGISL